MSTSRGRTGETRNTPGAGEREHPRSRLSQHGSPTLGSGGPGPRSRVKLPVGRQL